MASRSEIHLAYERLSLSLVALLYSSSGMVAVSFAEAVPYCVESRYARWELEKGFLKEKRRLSDLYALPLVVRCGLDTGRAYNYYTYNKNQLGVSRA